MTARSVFRETPAVRDLLTRTTWDDLNQIATRHGVRITGRRRDLLIERVAALLETPDQIRAAYGVLPPGARAVLGLLLLLGGVDDERVLLAARDAWIAARPDSAADLRRILMGNELQTLSFIGLIFRDRRRIAIAAETIDALTVALPPATPDTAPDIAARPLAQVQYLLDRLIALIAADRPVALALPELPDEHAELYRAPLLPPTALLAIGQALGTTDDETTLLLGVLQALGVVAAVRGRWQIQPSWDRVRTLSPRALLAALVDGWLRPRPTSDMQRSGAWLWMRGPDAEPDAVSQIEAQLRTIAWHWLRWCGDQPFSVASFAHTLATLHPALLNTSDETIWLVANTAKFPGVEPQDTPAIAQAIVPVWLQQLSWLGLVVTDGERAALTPAALWLIDARAQPRRDAIRSIDERTLLIDPLGVDRDVLRLIELAGTRRAPDGALMRYELTARSVARLISAEVDIPSFEGALIDSGAALDPAFRAQLADWQSRAGRIRIHGPLTAIVTGERVPLAQVLAAAGIGDEAEIIAPDCALIEDERADPAIDQLRGRGMWPRKV